MDRKTAFLKIIIMLDLCEIGCSRDIVLFSLQAISFLTPLAVIFVVKIIQRTDKTEIKEACLGECPDRGGQKI